MLGELIEVFSALRDDAQTRVVIVTGAPPVFSAGAHSAIKSGMSADERRRVFLVTRSQFRRLFERVNALPREPGADDDRHDQRPRDRRGLRADARL